ncbi:type II toxin-antitoxin system RelE/ParE family toxin [Rhodoferax sp.]|uniref:type II toxin-antitoxin system RelE/ParE family toxin n=1 Tax=Rhodoferax sp. TaxID=50421 RepID=UPI002622AFA6|nr:type II toxin-antitoxin system RelE/ParE family toxin [Rhodoferax sp.]MDD4942345.1 type II toxin-antitoxin system RelE/ParE family toxin [Rhodoferax sp.]MDD5479128.1 type II toxin-antitoxin system RelE/ParE family toxin [Rhodoferax sp.]
MNRTDAYRLDLQSVHDYIEQDNPDAAMKLLLHIEDQVDHLADPNFPRRMGRQPGTLELVVHANYVVVLQQTDTTVTLLNLLHVARQYP